MNFEVTTSPTFNREFKKLSKKYHAIKFDLADLVKSLKENPFQGDNLGRNCYKIRMKVSDKGKGKSGGSRVITCVKIANNQVKLLTIYDKSEQENISDGFLTQILSDNGLL